MKSFIKLLGFFLIFLVVISCKDEVLPKPKAMLRLDYTIPEYKTEKTICGFTFDKNKKSNFFQKFEKESCGLLIKYPKLKATIFLTHRNVNNDLRKLLMDAQNLTQEHVVKADDIRPKEYLNKTKKVYGMIYEVIGDAASPSQFYVTDSTKNFLLGSVYFDAKPNYDSILPAAEYLRNEVRILIESLKWK